MKPNKLTEGANVMWESSRMMLPEHVEAINRQKTESHRKPRPEFDEQHTAEFERMIRQYTESDIELFIVVYGEYEDRDLRGRITKYDPQLKRIKIESIVDGTDPNGLTDEYEWVSVFDIVDIFT